MCVYAREREREIESARVCVCMCAGVFRLYGDLWNDKERGGDGDKVDW